MLHCRSHNPPLVGKVPRCALTADCIAFLHLVRCDRASALAGFEALICEELYKGQTLLHCLKDEQEQLVRPLLALGLQINAVDSDGNSAMHTAASGGHAAVLRMLIMCSADPHITNKRGQDALLCAVRSKNNTMVRSSAPCVSQTFRSCARG
jgi:ankyrin repeat protein